MAELEQYLLQIDEGCRRLDPGSRAQALEEIRAHLDASIQARLELGLPLVEAERQAIDQFGTAKEIAKSLRAIHEPPKVHRPHFVCGAIAFGSMAFATWLSLFRALDPHTEFIILVWSIVIGIVLLMYSASKSPRLPLRGMLLLLPIASLWFTIAIANIHAPDGPARLGTRYDEAGTKYTAMLQLVSLREQSYERARIAYDEYLAGSNVMPTKPGHDESGYVLASSRAEAEARWMRHPVSAMRARVDVSRAEANHYRDLDGRYWWMGIPAHLVPVAYNEVLPWWIIMTMCSAMGWLMGAICRFLRKLALRARHFNGRGGPI